MEIVVVQFRHIVSVFRLMDKLDSWDFVHKNNDPNNFQAHTEP